jgi:hypothetical protein
MAERLHLAFELRSSSKYYYAALEERYSDRTSALQRVVGTLSAVLLLLVRARLSTEFTVNSLARLRQLVKGISVSVR